MIGNVDEQVSTMVDAYRGKPQVLQQKYAMTKDMVTLLALQRIKSEQDAAKRQQSLNAQPNNKFHIANQHNFLNYACLVNLGLVVRQRPNLY